MRSPTNFLAQSLSISKRSGRTNPLWILLAMTIVAVVLLVGLMNRTTSQTDSDNVTIKLYCAAGMRVPIDEIARQYEQEYGATIEIQYGGSNTLLNQLQINRSESADLYLAADDFYTDKAVKLGLAAETIPIAYSSPVVAVPANNPKQIDSIQDLLKEDVVLSLADPDQTAVGKAARERLQAIPYENGTLWDALEARARQSGVFKPTVNEVANDIKIGTTVHAGIVWDNTVEMPAYKGTMIRLDFPELQGSPNLVIIARLTASDQSAEALRFARYVAARDRGLTIFKNYGMTPVDGDVWEVRPELTFYCGAVNQKAVDKIIAEFMEREGVQVNTIYDGCGILTTRMRGIESQRTDLGFPDAYMACDRYYLEDVPNIPDWFEPATYVSEADLVLVVPKGSTKVKSLEDLVKPGVRVAIGEPNQCTIGVLTRKLLEAKGLYQALKQKQTLPDEVVVEKSSSAHLVPDVTTGHVDAAVAYVTDTLDNRDRIDVIPIDSPDSVAIQPFSIAHSSRHKYLARRLFQQIANSREAFEQAGFRFRLNKKEPSPGSADQSSLPEQTGDDTQSAPAP